MQVVAARQLELMQPDTQTEILLFSKGVHMTPRYANLPGFSSFSTRKEAQELAVLFYYASVLERLH